MRRLLLDTHVFIWWLEGSSKMSAQTRALIADGSNRVYVSAASTWEMTIKKSLGKLEFPDGLDQIVQMEGFDPLPVQIAHTLAIASLPLIHQDPFDRLLIAQARVEGLEFVSADTYAARYPVSVLAP